MEKEINIHLPCCNKVLDYEKAEFINRWGVEYIRCSKCDKNHPISMKEENLKNSIYKFKDGSEIDFSWQGIVDVIYPDTVSFYGWVIRPKTNEKFLIDFMYV